MFDKIRYARNESKRILFAATLLKESGGTVTKPHPLLKSSGAVQVCNIVCQKAGINVAPEIHCIYGGRDATFALVQENALVLDATSLRMNLKNLPGYFAHLLGHLAFQHSHSSPQVEQEADTLAKRFLRPDQLEAWIKYQEKKLSEVNYDRMHQNMLGSLWRLGKSKSEVINSAMYGNLNARIAALYEPNTPQQNENIDRAIASLNRRFTPSQHVKMEPIPPEPPHGGMQRRLEQRIQQAIGQRRQEEYGRLGVSTGSKSEKGNARG